MGIDAALWVLLVAMFGWVAGGCYATRPRPIQQRHEDQPHGPLDRAG